jgi:CheY-like chemotaxis protein/anti-sigma regulatory factor (Ser/Thr protein kinase)
MLELRYKPVQIENLIKEVGQIFSKSIEDKGLEFRIIYGSDLPEYLFLDGDRLIQILINLVGNAIKFSSRGFVEIEVSAHLTNDHGKIDLTIRIKDSGIGIAFSQQDVIFESFRQHSGQNSNKYGGTGLGLTISRQLTNMMHGEISLESGPESGAIFTVFFKDIDIVQQDESELSSSVHSNVSVVFSPSTLLIVDDFEINRTLLKYYLEDTNLHIIEAEDGKQALTAVEKESVDLILMDMEMPIMDGYEAVTCFRKNSQFADIPIIATTASVMDFSRKQMFESGCDDILEKPITKYGFLELLQRYLPYEQLPSGNRLTIKSGNEQDFSLDGGSVTPEMKANICSFLVIYRKDLASTFNEVQETSLMMDIATFAQDVRVLANAYSLDFIVRWSENCMKWANGFDVDNVMKTLDIFQKILTKMQTVSSKPDD